MPSQPQILLSLVLIPPFVSFALNALIPPLRKNRNASSGLSIIAVLISTLVSVVLLKINPRAEFIFEWIPLNIFSKIEFGFFTDPVALIMFFIVSLVSLVVQVYSLGYMSEESPPSLGRYYTFHSLFAFSMLGFVASLNLLQIYIFWELVGLCSYLLIGFWYTRPEASRAAVKAFWVTRFGDVGFAIGMVLLWGATGTFFLPELFAKAPDVSKQLITVCMFLILFGAMGKSAQFPMAPKRIRNMHTVINCLETSGAFAKSSGRKKVPVAPHKSTMPIANPTSPNLVTQKAFTAALDASGLVYQNPMRRYEQSPTSSQKI